MAAQNRPFPWPVCEVLPSGELLASHQNETKKGHTMQIHLRLHILVVRINLAPRGRGPFCLACTLNFDIIVAIYDIKPMEARSWVT